MRIAALWIAAALAQEPDGFRARALEAGRRLFADADPAQQARWVRILAAYGGDPDPGVSAPAVDALQRYVRRAVADGEARAVGTALEGLVQAGYPERLDLLRAVLGSRLPAHIRVGALRHLAELEGEASLPRLAEALDDPDLAGTAAVEIGRRREGSRDPRLQRRFRELGDATNSPWLLGVFARSLRRVGGDDVRPALEAWSPRLRGWDRTDAVWFLRGTNPERVVERLVQLELITTPPPQARFDVEESRDLILSAFAWTVGRVGLNVNRLDAPLDYPDWFRGFAAMSRGLFEPKNLRLDGGAVLFEESGRAYRCEPRELGDWYDLPAVLKAVNRALEDRDVAERFVGLDMGPQLACYVLVHPERMRQAAAEFELPPEPDPDAPRLLWMEAQKE